MAILIPMPFGITTPRKELAECWTCRRFGNPKGIFCALLLLVAGGPPATSVSSAAEPLPEPQVKAAFLVNFPKYVDWPAEAFAETNSPIVIAVLGETKVTGELQKIITNRTVNGRKIILQRLAPAEVPRTCHILFIAAAEQKRSSNLLGNLKAGVLTVGESDDFLERGGIINLARRDQKIALEVNLAATDRAGLKISSKLLSVAGVVKGRTR